MTVSPFWRLAVHLFRPGCLYFEFFLQLKFSICAKKKKKFNNSFKVDAIGSKHLGRNSVGIYIRGKKS